MSWGLLVFAGVLLYLAVFSTLGWYVASQCHRSPVEGVVLGMVFGPFGVVLVVLLPRGEKPAATQFQRGDPNAATFLRRLSES